MRPEVAVEATRDDRADRFSKVLQSPPFARATSTRGQLVWGPDREHVAGLYRIAIAFPTCFRTTITEWLGFITLNFSDPKCTV